MTTSAARNGKSGRATCSIRSPATAQPTKSTLPTGGADGRGCACRRWAGLAVLAISLGLVATISLAADGANETPVYQMLEDFKGRKLIAFGGEWSVGFLTKHNPGLELAESLSV